jgi:HlyD family secretion protein
MKVAVQPGAFVNPGERIALLEGEEAFKTNPNHRHDVLAYVSPGEGKRIKPGMEVQVIPATVKAEEYGVLLGKVTSVSLFPLSQRAMLNALGNPELVQVFSKGGAPLEVWIDLLADPANPSGFRWSSPQGPPEHIFFGTLCAVKFVVRRQAPITLVLPQLRVTLFGPEGPSGE